MLIQAMPRFLRETGFTMIETLVAIVILVIGLLGLAGMQVRIDQYQTESYQRAQAVVLLQDMVNRINANRKVAGCYVITTNTTNGTPYLGNGWTGNIPSCTLGLPTEQTTADQDLADWDGLLLGTAETTSGSNIGAMIGARGCISYDSTNNLYSVAVVWQGLSPTTAPTRTNCGTGQYGNDALRRAASATISIAALNGS